MLIRGIARVVVFACVRVCVCVPPSHYSIE